MNLLGNILWFIVVGFLSFIAWAITGLLWCLTIIGIPFGLQCFKIGSFTLFPFGKKVQTNFDSHPIANVIWIILFGWELALGYIVIAAILAITIIGIPFAKQCFKLANLSLLPFGAQF